MKKLLVLLAIAFVLFASCEPTTGGGGGAVLPTYQFDIAYFGTNTDSESGIDYASCLYYNGTYADPEYKNVISFYMFQIIKNTTTNEYTVSISKAEKRNTMYGEDYWKDDFTLVTNTGYSIEPVGNTYTEIWTKGVDSDNLHQTWIELTVTTNDITAIKSSDSIEITLNATDNTTLSFSTSSEFSTLVNSKF